MFPKKFETPYKGNFIMLKKLIFMTVLLGGILEGGSVVNKAYAQANEGCSSDSECPASAPECMDDGTCGGA